MKRINGRAIIIDGDEVLLMFRRKIENGLTREYYAIPGGGQEKMKLLKNVSKEKFKKNST